MLKILFLDIDGVLNSDKYSKWCHTDEGKEYSNNGGNLFIDKDAVKLIEEFCERYNVRIVISSSWRELSFEVTKKAFEQYRDLNCLIKYIVGITPRRYNKGRVRGDEIDDFITHIGFTNNIVYKQFYDDSFFTSNENKDTIDYCIIDDDNDMLPYQMNNFVRIDSLYGLTEDDVDKIKNILKITE